MLRSEAPSPFDVKEPDVSRSTGPLHRAVRTLPLAVALGLLTACSGGEGSAGTATTSATPPTSSAEESTTESAAPTSPEAAVAQPITATETNFAIELSEDTLTAGTYEISVVNEGGATHDLLVEQDGNDIAGTESIAPDGSTTLTVTLEPGDYTFYCSIGNHRAMGMELPVTVS